MSVHGGCTRPLPFRIAALYAQMHAEVAPYRGSSVQVSGCWLRLPSHISRAACSIKRMVAAGVRAAPLSWSMISR